MSKDQKTHKPHDQRDEDIKTETQEVANDGASPDAKDQSPAKDVDPLTELQEKYDTINDKYLRLYSEFENYRRRTSREKLDLMKNAGAEILKEFLPVVDDFDRAIAGNANDDNIENIKEGFKLIHHKLMRTLEGRGVKPMNSLEQPFDTEYHEAITNIPAPDESLKGKVVDVAEKGYFYHDGVLRYAKVVVGQ